MSGKQYHIVVSGLGVHATSMLIQVTDDITTSGSSAYGLVATLLLALDLVWIVKYMVKHMITPTHIHALTHTTRPHVCTPILFM